MLFSLTAQFIMISSTLPLFHKVKLLFNETQHFLHMFHSKCDEKRLFLLNRQKTFNVKQMED